MLKYFKKLITLNTFKLQNKQSIMKFICSIILFGCIVQCSFGLPVKEKKKVQIANKPGVFETEVLVSPLSGIENGLRVYYRIENGEILPKNKKKGFQLGFRPTGNWYDRGFILKIDINGREIKLLKSKFQEVIKLRENTKDSTTLLCLFDTEVGTLSFDMIFLKNKYYAFIKIAITNPKETINDFKVSFLNHPGHYGKYSKAKIGREVITSTKTVVPDGRAHDLKNRMGWVFYYDKNSDFYGSSALMYQNENIQDITMNSNSNGYAVKTTVTLKKNFKSVNFLFWEFPKKRFTTNLALSYLKTEAAKLQKELKQLSKRKVAVANPTREISKYEMTKISVPVKIDGKMEKSIWGKIPWSSSFYYLGTDKKAAPVTKFKLGYDDEFLYFYIDCEEPKMLNLKIPERNKACNIAKDDYVELFLCPYGEHADYFHYIINSAGAIWDAKQNKGKTISEWNGNMKVATSVGKNSWAVEGKIPFKDIVQKDKKTLSVWLANVSRQRLASANLKNSSEKWSSWSKIFVKSFNSSSFFNVLSGFKAPFVKKHTAFRQEDDYNELYIQDQPIECFFPRSDILIANNVAAPNFIKIKDMRLKYKNFLSRSSSLLRRTDDWKEYIDTLDICIRLPEKCSLYTGQTAYWAFFSVKKDTNYYRISPLRKISANKYKMKSRFSFDKFMLYVKTTLPVGAKGEIEIWIEQKTKQKDFKTSIKKYPFRVVKFPKVKMLKRFVVNMWANEYIFIEPDHVATRKKLGFNSVSPKITWVTRNPGNDAVKSYLLDMVKKARSEKMKVCVHDSTFSRLYFSKEGRWGNNKFPDPAYTGPAYQRDISEVKKLSRLFKPDYLFIDCEYFHHAVSRKAINAWPEGKARITNSGLSVKDYFTKFGDRMARDVNKALNFVDGKKSKHIVKFGFYGTGDNFSRKEEKFPGNEMYDGVLNIHSLLKNKLVDFVQPSPYHAGDMMEVINCLKALKKNLKSPKDKILTWACAGYPSPFSGEMVRDQFLEVCSFGAIGIAYWGEHAWDVNAYLNQVYAVNEISPFEDIVLDGKYYEQKQQLNSTTYVKGMVKNNEAIILLSCYKRFKGIKKSIKNPLGIDCSVYNASSQKKIADIKKGASITVDLDIKRDTKLLYFGNAWEKRLTQNN